MQHRLEIDTVPDTGCSTTGFDLNLTGLDENGYILCVSRRRETVHEDPNLWLFIVKGIRHLESPLGDTNTSLQELADYHREADVRSVCTALLALGETLPGLIKRDDLHLTHCDACRFNRSRNAAIHHTN